jgi:ParB-like chromosome segregation protein Spo0J
MKVRIRDIVLADDINIRRELREETVEHYTEILDDLPPVAITEVAGKKLLTDGWHRLAAATRIGRTEIEATVTSGDRTEAMVAAIVANTKHGLPLNTAERDEGIMRLVRAGWAQKDIARTLGASTSRINAIVQRSEIPVPGLAVSIRDEVVAAPREYRIPVAEAAAAGGWSQQETREVARRLSDPLIPEEEKRQIVAERMTVVDGQPAIDAGLVSEFLTQARERHAGAAILAFTRAAATLHERLRNDPEPLAGLRERDLRDISDGLDEAELVIGKLRGLL